MFSEINHRHHTCVKLRWKGKAMPVTHFVLLLLMFFPSLRQSPAAQSQTNSEQQRAATISGRVTLNGDGVEDKLQPGGSISGKAIIEGATDPLALAALAKSSQILIECVSQDPQGVVFQRKTTRVKADGSFRIEGVQPGKIYLSSAQSL